MLHRAEGGSLDAGTSAAGAGLAGLFEPPRSIMFTASSDKPVSHAQISQLSGCLHRAEGGSLDAGTSVAGAGLAGLFEPPRSIMFQGSFEEAKAAAVEKSQWLVRLCTPGVACGRHASAGHSGLPWPHLSFPVQPCPSS